MDRSYVQPLAQKPFTVFRIGGRRADEQQLCAGAAPAERYQVKDLSPSVSLEQRVKLAGVFTCVCLQPTSCQVPGVPVCFTHLGHTLGPCTTLKQTNFLPAAAKCNIVIKTCHKKSHFVIFPR